MTAPNILLITSGQQHFSALGFKNPKIAYAEIRREPMKMPRIVHA